MTVQNALEEMKERAFAPAFQKYLFDTYKVLAQTDFSEEEKDYTAAEDYFTSMLSTPACIPGSSSTFPIKILLSMDLKSISCKISLRCRVCSAILCF